MSPRSRRWRAIALTATGAAFIIAGSVIQALHAHDAAAEGSLFAVAAVVCVVAALAVVRGGPR